MIMYLLTGEWKMLNTRADWQKFFQMGNFFCKNPGAEALFSKIKTPKEAIVSLPVKMSGGGAATSKTIMRDIAICGTPSMNNVGTLHFF